MSEGSAYSAVSADFELELNPLKLFAEDLIQPLSTELDGGAVGWIVKYHLKSPNILKYCLTLSNII